ncbi:MAG: MarR family transcriptional regulator [Hyphomonadaceae bacterium]|nr:MarR family transcriptional regulator [Hyphomonadaceae bacterium]
MTQPSLQYPESDPPLARVLNEIAIIAQLSRAAMERGMPEGVSAAGFGVLNHLARLPGEWSPARLARAFQVTKGAMTNTLQRLEAAGLVRVDADAADGRAKIVRLLPKGLKTREETIARLGPDLAALTQALPEGLLGELAPRLAVLRAVMDRARD